MLKINNILNELTWDIDKKNREILKLKMIRRELSEREFLDKIAEGTQECKKYRNKAFKLMKKF
jgi:hypothetical protein